MSAHDGGHRPPTWMELHALPLLLSIFLLAAVLAAVLAAIAALGL